MPKYLGQIVAIEAGIRKAAMRKLTDAYHALDRPAMLEGISGTYEPAVDGGEQLPNEGVRVQATAEEMITATRGILAEMFDATAARDFTNCSGTAKANIVVGDQALIENAPVPYILWLLRELDKLQAFVTRIPTLSPSTTWELEEARGVYRSEPVRTARQVQAHRVLKLADATERHQEQVQVVQEAVTAGTWTRVKFTGAVPVSRREEILQRITTLRAALHSAHQEANRVEALEPGVGTRLLSFLFD